MTGNDVLVVLQMCNIFYHDVNDNAANNELGSIENAMTRSYKVAYRNLSYGKYPIKSLPSQ